MDSWLVRWALSPAERDKMLAGVTELYSWARLLNPRLPLSILVYKKILARLIIGGNPAMNYHPINESSYKVTASIKRNVMIGNKIR